MKTKSRLKIFIIFAIVLAFSFATPVFAEELILSRTLTSAEILSMNSTTKIELLPALSSGFGYNFLDVQMFFEYNSTPYATGTAGLSFTHGGSSTTTIGSTQIKGTADYAREYYPQQGPAGVIMDNGPVEVFFNSATNYTAGDSEIHVFIRYEIVDFSTGFEPLFSSSSGSPVISPLMEWFIIFSVLSFLFLSIIRFIIKYFGKLL